VALASPTAKIGVSAILNHARRLQTVAMSGRVWGDKRPHLLRLFLTTSNALVDVPHLARVSQRSWPLSRDGPGRFARIVQPDRKYLKKNDNFQSADDIRPKADCKSGSVLSFGDPASQHNALSKALGFWFPRRCILFREMS
jgi:hypothetical protein